MSFHTFDFENLDGHIINTEWQTHSRVNDMDDEYQISADKARLDLAMIHDFLANRSYWAKGIPLSVLKKSIKNSLCFGVYHKGSQVGFARVVTDYATTAYLGDVFILENYRGKGLGKRLVETVIEHPSVVANNHARIRSTPEDEVGTFST